MGKVWKIPNSIIDAWYGQSDRDDGSYPIGGSKGKLTPYGISPNKHFGSGNEWCYSGQNEV